MKTRSLDEVQAELDALLDDVEANHERIVVTRNGQPSAILIAVDDLESLEDPELVAAIREAEADIAAGRVFTLDEVVASMRASGRIV